MTHKWFGILAALTLSSTIAHAGSAPKELYGKSITVAWSENIESNNTGQRVIQNHMEAHTLSVYVSNAGRTFARLLTAFANSGPRGKGANQFKGGSQVDQDPEHAVSTNQIAARFEGRQLLLDTKFESGARRVAVNFNGEYSTCNVTIIQGREGGAKTMVIGGFGAQRREIHSIQTVAAACSIREGNIFAGG